RGLKELGVGTSVVCQPLSPLSIKLKKANIQTFEINMRCEADAIASWKISEEVRKGKFDIIHMHDSHSHWLGACASFISGRPHKVVSRRVDFSIKRHGFGLSVLKYKYFADTYITVSEAVRKALLHDGIPQDRIHNVYSGVEMQKQNKNKIELKRLLRVGENEIIIGAVGSLVWHKGYEILIYAAASVVKRFPDVRFVIFGDGPLYNSLTELINKLQLSEKVILTGFIEEAQDYISALDVYVSSSIMEGLGTSLLDALVFSKPVAASAAGGIPEIIENNKTGLLVPVGSPEALAEAICSLISNSTLSRILGEAGRELVKERFSAEKMVESTLNIYAGLMRNSK
ncbi:MAG: glycosyltransferase family 4 protein, partial [Planctomycetota bacterium]